MTNDPPDAFIPSARLGVVAIGRNEGERMTRCLRSIGTCAAAVVYVDSGSTDGSVEAARAFGARVIVLDTALPFTAARARNEGWRALRAAAPDVEWIQFVDGDCEMAAGWLATGGAFLANHPDVAAVCGRRRERFPERSIYNRLCDMEWDLPAGSARAFGGDVMVRLVALERCEGFRDALIAGEEPELGVRLRASGWTLWRLGDDMTVHDAAMTRFGQWWRRSQRAGFAFAEGAAIHGAPPERHWVREARSARVWAGVIPLCVLAGMAAVGPWFAIALLVYPAQVLRLAMRTDVPLAGRLARAFFLVLGKFPELQGQLRFFRQRWSGAGARLIEYK